MGPVPPGTQISVASSMGHTKPRSELDVLFFPSDVSPEVVTTLSQSKLVLPGVRRDSLGLFLQVDAISEAPGNTRIQLMADWGSSGRVFKPCQLLTCGMWESQLLTDTKSIAARVVASELAGVA